MVKFTFEGRSYNFTSGSTALSFARSEWPLKFGTHSSFIKQYEEAAFQERYPEGYTVSDPRTGKKRFVSPEEAYTRPEVKAALKTETTEDVTAIGIPPINGTKKTVPLTTVPPATITPAATTSSVASMKSFSFSSDDRLLSTVNRFELELSTLAKRESALNKVIESVGDIDALHEALQVRDKLKEYTKGLESTAGVNNTLITLYNQQIGAVKDDLAKNKIIHDDIVANKSSYTPESYAKHLEDWAQYTSSVKATLAGYANAVSGHQSNAQGIQAALTQSKTGRAEVTQWAKDKVVSLKEAMKPPVMEYSVTYTENGAQKVKTFTTEMEQLNFVSQQQNAQMQKANFSGTWNDYVKEVNSQKAYLSWLTAKGVIGIEGGEARLLKPPTVLTDEELNIAGKAGFDIPKLPLGASLSLYQWGKDTFPEKSFIGESVEAAASGLGQFLEVLWAPYRFVASIIPGEQPYEEGFRGVTPATMKYVEDLTPTQQAALDIGGLASTVGASYLAALPVGLAARGLTSLSTAISTKLKLASRLKISSPKAISTVKNFLATHPKALQAVMWAPMAGLEATVVYDKIQKGVPATEIIRDEAYKIASIYGGIKGFKAGYNIVPIQKWARLQKLIKIEEFDDPRRPGQKRALPTIDSKKIPQELADLLRIELDPITGKEIVVGPATEAGITRNVGRQYGNLLKDLAAGKAVTTDPINSIRGTILEYATPDQYASLLQRGLNIQTMSAQEIADLMMKELNWYAGSPWQQMLKNAEMEFLKSGGKTTIDVIAAFSERMPQDSGVLGLTKGRDLYNALISDGMGQQQALMYATEIMTAKTPTVLISIAAEAGLSQQATQNVVGAYLTYGASSGEGTALVQSLSKAGLTMQETKTVMPLLLQQYTAPATITQHVPNLSAKALAVVIPVLTQSSQRSLQKALPQLSTSVLVNVAPVLDKNVVAQIMPHLSHDALISVVPALNDEVLASIIPRLKPLDLSDSVSKLTESQIKIFVDLIPDLTLDQIAYTIPRLDVDQITLALQQMQFDVPTLTTAVANIPIGAIPFLPNFPRRVRDAMREKRSRSLDPYKVTFRQPHVRAEIHHVKARSFREALIVAWKLKRRREDPSEVEVEKLKAGLK